MSFMEFPIQHAGVSIRPEKIGDAPAMKHFRDRLIEERALIGANTKRSLAEWEMNITRAVEEVKSRRAVVLVATIEHKIVGSGAIFLLGQKMAHIGELGVILDRDFRRQGIGRKMVELVIAWAMEWMPGLQCVELGAISANLSALNLYRHLGFREVARLPNEMNHFGVYYDELILHKWVRPLEPAT